MTTVTGVPVSPGRVADVVVRMPDPIPRPPSRLLAADASIDEAVAAVERSAAAVQEDLQKRALAASGNAAELLMVTAAMAADPSLAKEAVRRVREHRATAQWAVWEAADQVVRRLESLGGHMAERAGDVRDVRDRIVADLTGLQTPGVPDPGHPFVLVARDLAPADTAVLDPQVVRAIVTSGGGPTSHTAILARSLGIPAVVAAPGADDLAAGQMVLVDGSTGVVLVDPEPEAVAAATGAQTVRAFDGEGRTADGHHVELLANVGDPSAAPEAVDANAEGVGLFRTEFCFLGRTKEPSLDEQITAYRAVFSQFPGRKVLIRTLDAGADKPLSFVTADREPNPALGVRGLRTAAAHPDVLDRQLQAIAAAGAAEKAEVWVMAPMVATVDEARDFVATCARWGLRHAGVMIEVPSAALQSRFIFGAAKFASLGTNDLIQYTLAADRELGELAALSTPWQPAVLQLIKATCDGAMAAGAAEASTTPPPVGVCGEAAADPLLARVLVGLGVTSLSMTPRALGDVAHSLEQVTFEECRRLAQLALDQPTAEAAREAVANIS